MDEDDEFEEFFRAVRPRLVRSLAVLTRGDLDTAAEAADEALVRALERWPRVSAMASPEAWTYTVGRNLLRRGARRRRTEDAILRSRRTDAVTPDHSTQVEDTVTVWEAVAELSPADQERLALRYLIGLSEAEVAEATRSATGTVSAGMARARRRLRSLLGEDR